MKARDIKQSLVSILTNVHLDAEVAENVAKNLVLAKINNHDSHSINLIERYLYWIKSDLISKNSNFSIKYDKNQIIIDGSRVFGQHVIKTVINQPANHDLEIFLIKNLAHSGYFKGIFLDSNLHDNHLIVMFSNIKGSKLAIPFNGNKIALSSNSVFMSLGSKLSFDFSTTSTTESQMLLLKNQNQFEVPPGKLIHENGQVVTNINEFYEKNNPLVTKVGLTFENYKMFYLNILCEILGGIVTNNGLSIDENKGLDTGIFGFRKVLNDEQMKMFQNMFAAVFENQNIYIPKNIKYDDDLEITLSDYEKKVLDRCK